jgi:hypothetical protein
VSELPGGIGEARIRLRASWVSFAGVFCRISMSGSCPTSLFIGDGSSRSVLSKESLSQASNYPSACGKLEVLCWCV